MKILPSLCQTVRAWGEPDFEAVFKRELAGQAEALPLQQALTLGSRAMAAPVAVVLLHADEQGGTLCLKAGIFYRSVIAGCSCADDPTPPDENNEYCTVLLRIDRSNGVASVELLAA